MPGESVQRKLAAIVALDAVGWSRLMGVDEAGTLATLKGHREAAIDPKIAHYKGRIVKTTGDGLLAEFASAVDAVKCASEIQEAMAERNIGVPESVRMAFRIGVNLGEIIVDNDDIFGDGVNIAARLQELAAPGTVNISEDVYRQVHGRLDAGLEDLGPQELKNIANPVHVYRVGGLGSADTAAPSSTGDSQAPAAAGATGFEARPAIAVLPFDNMSRDEEQEYFADGIAEDLITALSLWRLFPVIARNSSFTYKGQKVDVKQVGRELGARYVLEGSVRKAGKRVRVTAQLIDAKTGAHVWAERFDRELEDIFDLQDEITGSIVTQIVPEISHAEAERATRTPPASLDAWEYYQRGQWHINRYTKDDNTKARDYFDEALTRDPTLSLAASWQATSNLYEVLFGWSESPQDALSQGLTLARQAVALNVQDAVAHAILGAALALAGEPERGVEEGSRAIELNPSLALAHFCRAFPLIYLRRNEEALAGVETAIQLSPRDPMTTIYLAVESLAQIMLRRFDEAIVSARKALREQPDNVRAHHRLIVALAHNGELDAARAAYEESKRVLPEPSMEYFVASYPFTHAEDLDLILDGMRKAGWPG